jgi:uncharacterized membrane protein
MLQKNIVSFTKMNSFWANKYRDFRGKKAVFYALKVLVIIGLILLYIIFISKVLDNIIGYSTLIYNRIQ